MGSLLRDAAPPQVYELLQADDVSFAYGDQPVVRGVSFDVPPGGLVGVIGPNGSGKTTLLRLLSGARLPLSGRVLLDGRPSTSWSRPALARRLAVVPQQSRIAFEFTVLEVVLMGRHPHLGAFQVEGPRDLAIARRALAATDVAALAARPFSKLSGGEQQRVILASALAQIDLSEEDSHGARPILLLDEPTAALDLKHQLALGTLLRRLHAERGLTVVLSTHDLSFAATLCTAFVLLKAGQVVAAGPTEQVLTADHIRRLYDVEVEVVRLPGRRPAIVPLDAEPQLRHG